MSASPALRSSHPARVSWFELFYDLVLVAAIANGSHLIARQQEFGLGAWLIGTFVITFVVWFSTSLAINICPGKAPARETLMFVQMMAMTTANLALSRSDGLADSWGFAGLAVAFATVGAIYLSVVRSRAELRRALSPGAWGMGGAAALLALGAAVPDLAGSLGTALLGLGLLSAVVPMAAVVLPRLCEQGRLNPEHLAERIGEFVIIVLGESFLALTLLLSGLDALPSPFAYLLALVVAGSLWLISFTSIQPMGIPTSAGRLNLWLAALVVFLIGAAYSASLHAAYASQPGDWFSRSHPFAPLPMFYVLVGAVLLSMIGGSRRLDAAVRIHGVALTALLVIWGVMLLLGISSGNALMLMGSAVIIIDALACSWWRTRADRTRSSG